MQHIF